MRIGEFVFEDGVLRGRLDLRSYRLAAIKKAAYRLADRFTLALGAVTEDAVAVTLSTKASLSPDSARELTQLLMQELLDQELREQVAEETKPVRTLILAQAFSKTDLIGDE